MIVSAVRGHPRSIILVPIESAYATSYYSAIETMVLSCTVSEIRRHIGQKLPIFPTLSHSAHPLPMFALEFCGVVNHEETIESLAILQRRPHDRSLSHFDMIPDCNGQTDGRNLSQLIHCFKKSSPFWLSL